jgi:ATP-binding cassette subfamily B protein
MGARARLGSRGAGELEMKPRKSEAAILRRMALEARPYWPHILGIFLLSLLSTPLTLLTPLPLKIVIDSVIGSRPLPGFLLPLIPRAAQHSPGLLLAMATIMLVGVTLLTHLQWLASWLLETYAGESMVLNFRARLFAHVQRLSLAYHDSKGAADSAYRIEYDAPSLQYITINGVVPLISAFSTLAGMIYITTRLDWQLALVALGIAPVLFALTQVFGGWLRQRWTAVKELESSANSVVMEALSAMRVVKAFGREDHEHKRFLTRSNHRLRELLQVYGVQGGYDLLVGVTLALGTAAALYVGVLHVRRGLLSVGDLLLVSAYIGQLFEPLKSVTNKLADLQGSLASAERAFALLDEAPDVAERPHARALKRATGAVRFDNVSFAYDGEHPVLTDASLEAPSGARVGIQGRSGAGKSTLMSLLTRLYDVSGGRILLDGVDIRDYKLADLRNQFAIVLQDAVLFSTTIAENIAYGHPDASERQIIEAARLANAHDFIANLPEGYGTLVGERGMSLSGGERQRISLARAFLKDAPILILDEPTSALDIGTEASILEALERLMHGRTTFMIAHRLTTLDRCDLRLEIDQGHVGAVVKAAVHA